MLYRHNLLHTPTCRDTQNAPWRPTTWKTRQAKSQEAERVVWTTLIQTQTPKSLILISHSDSHHITLIHDSLRYTDVLLRFNYALGSEEKNAPLCELFRGPNAGHAHGFAWTKTVEIGRKNAGLTLGASSCISESPPFSARKSALDIQFNSCLLKKSANFLTKLYFACKICKSLISKRPTHPVTRWYKPNLKTLTPTLTPSRLVFIFWYFSNVPISQSRSDEVWNVRGSADRSNMRRLRDPMADVSVFWVDQKTFFHQLHLSFSLFTFVRCSERVLEP